ncbi:MAG: DUF1311 domain-containing protein [Holosporales bacterium]|jgi:uncharacterized protein YecT (DUF1311 family)|nr:DUF1311 domain-containing protein [Holosporales bacterium]
MKKLMFLVMFIIGTTVFASYRADLIKKMSTVDSKIQKVYDNPNASNASMINACESGRKAWDVELNAVYKLLMKELSKEEQELLRKDERQWIKDRDAAAEEAADDAGGGTMSSLASVSTLFEETKKRTIELAELYDSL